MAREDWPDREDTRRTPRDRRDFGQADYSRDYAYDPEGRTGYRAERDQTPGSDDYGQADYSSDYGYEPDGRRAFRREAERDLDEAPRRAEQPRSWMDRAADAFGIHDSRVATRPRYARSGPSDRVLWAVIVERLEAQRGLDLRHVDVSVDRAEVTLNGYVRRKADKRRIEDVADIDGVRHVQNNLRVHERWTFF